MKKALQQAFCNWRKLQHQLHSSSKEWSTEFFSEIDLNNEVFSYISGDQIHLKEVYIILYSRNTLLKVLESRRINLQRLRKFVTNNFNSFFVILLFRNKQISLIIHSMDYRCCGRKKSDYGYYSRKDSTISTPS
ncbi:hypothetical protein H5410_032891 [Solanum commersonii]|uniref:Uncharacterized protein n=1 Tax=Solanum commersonii TaxID=4109 RepID=A0A9J5YM94_SOLCO|nr:hypothetical protein H5410_032891 [Solanum commersonii]